MGYTYTEAMEEIEQPDLSDFIAYLIKILKSGEAIIIHGNNTRLTEELAKAGFQEIDGVWNNDN